MLKFMLIRLFSFLTMFFVAILLPAWGVLTVSLIGLVLFDKFYEAIFAGFWFDLLYGSSALSVTTTFYLTLISILMFFLVIFLKRIVYTHAQI